MQKISHQEWRQVFALLDTALDLPAQARDSWLDQLEHQPVQITNALRELLARRASRESGDFLQQLPHINVALAIRPIRIRIDPRRRARR
jgi:hypothetical protein